MRYIVIIHNPADYDHDLASDIQAVVPCETPKMVSLAIQSAKEYQDWAVFELVGSNFERRAVVFPLDVDKVEIQ